MKTTVLAAKRVVLLVWIPVDGLYKIIFRSWKLLYALLEAQKMGYIDKLHVSVRAESYILATVFLFFITNLRYPLEQGGETSIERIVGMAACDGSSVDRVCYCCSIPL